MSATLDRIIDLVSQQDVRVSDHGYDELLNDGIFFRELAESISNAKLIEDYPDYHKGPAVLVRQTDRHGDSIHVVWGIPKGFSAPAVLVTAYRPDPRKWTDDFMRRRK